MVIIRLYLIVLVTPQKLVIGFWLRWQSIRRIWRRKQNQFLILSEASKTCLLIKPWRHWQLKTRKGSMLLLRSMLKMCCSLLLPPQSDNKTFILPSLQLAYQTFGKLRFSFDSCAILSFTFCKCHDGVFSTL